MWTKKESMIRTYVRTSLSGLLGAGLIAVTVTTALYSLGPVLLLEIGGLEPGPERSADLKAEIDRYAETTLGTIALSVPLGLFGACFALWAVMRRALVGLAGRRPGLVGAAAGLAHTLVGAAFLVPAYYLQDGPVWSLVSLIFSLLMVIGGHALVALSAFVFLEEDLSPVLGVGTVAAAASAAGFLAGRFYAWRVGRYRLNSDSNGSSENSASTGTSK
jgi:hypothetical protein